MIVMDVDNDVWRKFLFEDGVFMYVKEEKEVIWEDCDEKFIFYNMVFDCIFGEIVMIYMNFGGVKFVFFLDNGVEV